MAVTLGTLQPQAQERVPLAGAADTVAARLPVQVERLPFAIKLQPDGPPRNLHHRPHFAAAPRCCGPAAGRSQDAFDELIVRKVLLQSRPHHAWKRGASASCVSASA
jgi:hypothetical protein